MEDKNIEEVAAPTTQNFEGFRKIDKESKHFYKLPNEWTNIMASINNLAELKVIEYLMRHTWGFGEYDQYKHITVDEFMHGRMKDDGTRMDEGTGLKSDRSVKDGLKAAIDHGYILCDVDDKDKARIKKSYKLKMRQVDTTPQNDGKDNGQVVSTPQEGNSYPSGTQNLPPDQVAATYRSKKETSGRNFKKEREKDITVPSSRQTPNVSTGQGSSHSFIHSQNQSLVSSQQTTKPEAKPNVVFPEEAEQVYQFAEKLNLVALKRDEDHKGYCDTLVEKGITALEDFEKLLQYCEQLPIFANKTDKRICLKNLTNALPGWLQLQRRSTAAPSTGVVTSTMAKATAELLAKEEETKQRILAQEAAKGQRPMRPSERILERSAKVSPEVAEQPSASASQQSMPDQEQRMQPATSTDEQPARPKYGPKLNEAPTYQRLETKSPAARPRSAWARQQAAKEAQEGAMK